MRSPWRAADIAGLARRHGTPFFLFDSARADRALREWTAAGERAGGFRFFYAVKCNRHPPLLDAVVERSFGLEVNVPGDLAEAHRRGLAGESLIVHGPAKSDSMLGDAVAHGHLISVESPEELVRVLGVAGRRGGRPAYLLRVRPPRALLEDGQRSFGMPPAAVSALLRSIARAGRPMPSGFLAHTGTGIPRAPHFAKLLAVLAPLADLAGRLGARVRFVGVGGGFGARGEQRREVPFGRPRPESDRPELYVRALAEARRRLLPKGTELLLEPGRAVASDAFALVARVIQTRREGKRWIVYVDASAASHLRFVPRGRHPVEFAPPRRGGAARCVIQGPLGTEIDTLVADWKGVPPREGDCLVVGSVGAYNLISASSWSGPVPAVVEASVRGARRRAGGGPSR